ncbi:MAG: class I SAM-dependent methyltransferase [Elusimicrobia bacterium]|nr:class I SAM-dependent methyltransferase [Elusimicrobiota bacterium]
MKKSDRRQAWEKVYAGKKRADEYQALLRLSGGKWYLDMLGAATQALSFLEAPPKSMLELGVGTGRLASRLLRHYPRARLYALDGSEAMLQKARRNLSTVGGGRVEFIRRDFGRRHWSRGLPKIGAVISTIAIHHLTDAGKRRLFREVWAQLEPGGIFIHGDPVWPRSRSLKDRDDRMWATYIQGRLKRLKGEDKPVGAIVDWIDETRDAEGDKPASLESQLDWLREAGFEHVDCYWKNFGFAVFGGVKPRW